MIYLTLIALLLVLIYHYDYQEHIRGRREWFIIIAIYFTLMAGLRYRVGGDTVSYMYDYIDYPNLSEYFSYDFSSTKNGRAYMLLGAIAKSISDDFVVLQCILAIFLNSVIFTFFYKNTNHIFSASLLYFFLFFFNLNTEVLRESCAVAMFLIGWKYFYSSKWLKYYICCLIAILFHPSAAFTILLPISKLRRLNRIFTPSWISFAIAIGLFLIGIIITSKFFDIIRLMEIATVDNYAQTYENSRFGEGRNYNITGTIVFLFKNFLYPLVCGFLISKQFISLPKIENSSYRSALLAMLMSFLYIASLSSSMIILARFNNYLIPFLTIIIADVFFSKIKIKRKTYRLSFITWIIFIVPYLSIYIQGLFDTSNPAHTPYFHKYYPYYSVLNPQLDRERELLIKYNYFK